MTVKEIKYWWNRYEHYIEDKNLEKKRMHDAEYRVNLDYFNNRAWYLRIFQTFSNELEAELRTGLYTEEQVTVEGFYAYVAQYGYEQ